MVAQGLGNICCGLLGRYRSPPWWYRGAANIDAGAVQKLAAITHIIFLLLAVLLIPSPDQPGTLRLPRGHTPGNGIQSRQTKLFINMWSLGWKQFLPFLITIVVILLTDLLKGVSIGLFCLPTSLSRIISGRV